jgi:hypothetical protein
VRSSLGICDRLPSVDRANRGKRLSFLRRSVSDRSIDFGGESLMVSRQLCEQRLFRLVHRKVADQLALGGLSQEDVSMLPHIFHSTRSPKVPD